MPVIAVQGDITAQEVDVIVNAANERLAHGGGVAAALARAGGPRVQQESHQWVAERGELGPGDAAVTTAGDLAARWIVHVVGPRHREGQDNEVLLRQAVVAALDRSRELGARSAALPAISAGIFGYPVEEATRIIATECLRWSSENPGNLDEIRLVGFDAAVTAGFAAALEGS